MFTEDLDPFFADFGVPVSFDGAPDGVLGLEDFLDESILGGRDGYGAVVGRQRTLLLPSSVATLLSEGMALTVDGVSREVLDPRAIPDGAFTVVTLR